MRAATLLVVLCAAPPGQPTWADPAADARSRAIRAAASSASGTESAASTSADAQLRGNLNRFIEGHGGNERLRERARLQAERTRGALDLQAAALRGDANAGRQLERVIIEAQAEPQDSVQARVARRMPAPNIKQGYRRTEDPVTGEVCETVDIGLWSPFPQTVCGGGKQGPGTPPGSIINELNRK
jgi:hypothetical protein